MKSQTYRSILLALTGALAVSGVAVAADAGTPTFYADILPVLQENCQTCHRPEGEGENIGGMIAPMPLMTYQQTRPWARSIARAVENRSMPPWFATEATRGQFHHERVMTDEEIETVMAWARGGAPAGDAAAAPPPKTFVEEGSGGWSLGRPDLVVQMPEEYWVADDIADININFEAELTEEMLPEPVWVRGVEFKVGGSDVHHMCASIRPPGGATALGKFSDSSLGCIALGAESHLMEPGYAMKLEPGSTIEFSMHYNKEAGEGSGFSDRSEIGFVFADVPESELREVKFDSIGNLTFEIPPGHERWKVGAARVFPVETDILALWPHAHLRSVAVRYDAFYPDGTTEVLLDVPNYDQEWQTTYQYKKPKTIPAGTRVEVSMWFENTPERGEERGFDPADNVINGTATTDEMMLGFVAWAPVEPVDPIALRLGVASIQSTGGGE